METRNNGPGLFKTTLLEHWNWKQVPLATDGHDGNGLQIGPLFLKFSLRYSKNHYKLIKFCSPFKNPFHVFFFMEF